ncbi:MAG: hypothetical protein JWP91_1509 [Fibrobacteres bacterium]|nr:hypothetical protein [Fibrobacterota bacterium]
MRAAPENVPGPVRSGQKGIAIVMVLFFLIVATLIGAVAYRKIKAEGSGTVRNANMTKAKFLSEAAVYLGLAVAQGDFPYTCVTHAPNGIDPALGADACAAPDLAKITGFYASPLVRNPSTGWLESSPATPGEALTGSTGEKIAIKIWMPSADTVRVVGRAVFNGITEDTQLFGNWGGT